MHFGLRKYHCTREILVVVVVIHAAAVFEKSSNDSIVLPRLAETDSGEYMLSFEVHNGTSSSMTVSLRVALERPTKPQLTLERIDKKYMSPELFCVSEGCPMPKIEWTGNESGKVTTKSGRRGSKISSSNYIDKAVMCCASNAVDQECSQLYDYDLDVDQETEVSNVTVSPAEGFLSVQLDKSKTVLAAEASSSCLQANVSYHPVLQHCSWQAPDKTISKCTKDKWFNSTDDGLTAETVTLAPANYTWMYCSSPNDSCETDSSWKEIEGSSQTESDVLCHKTIRSSLRKDDVVGHQLRFCVTNSVGSWCFDTIYYQPLFQASTESDNNSLMVLKVGSLLLLLALVVVTVVLIHFVKKKKPQYQPQLQMIQMVGPNDNDYIYINFKDFEYDQKWEFPGRTWSWEKNWALELSVWCSKLQPMVSISLESLSRWLSRCLKTNTRRWRKRR
ncbi:hypothetical protein INR49_014495 [Caranx melampygus]|nr:hypothetical protein INR49_014495 [Caranx melampygus]